VDKLRAMRTFVEIVDAGSLTAAAKVLDSSLPAVVRVLAHLEEELGVRLLNRTTRRSSLTDEGRRYLARCRQIVADVDDAEREASVEQHDLAGPIALTTPVLFGQMYVAPAVMRFVKCYPRVHVTMLLVDRVVSLLGEGFDLSVRIGPLSDSSLIAHSVGTVRRVTVASPEYLSVHGVPRHPRELSRANCVRTYGQTARVFRFREKGRTFEVPVSGSLEFNETAPAIAACEAGFGFGRFVSYQIAQAVAERRLTIVLNKFEEAPKPIHIAYPSARLLPSRTRALVEALRSELKAASVDWEALA
jgi:DNA-binding transcriptional LysR family regulator